MEKPIERHLDEIIHQDNVKSVVCLDSQGMILGSKKTSPEDLRKISILSEIPECAHGLLPDRAEMPVVVFETNEKNILLRKENLCSVAIIQGSNTVKES